MNTPRHLLIALTLVLPAGALAADAVDAGAAAKEASVSLELAAMPLRSSSDKVDAKLVSVLSELVLAQISEDGRFTRLISGSDLAEPLINLEQQKDGRFKAGARLRRVLVCMTEFAKALEVPYLLVGEIGLIGQQTVFNLKILDVKNAKVVAREGGVAETTDQAPQLAKDTTAKTLATFFASVSPDAVKRAQERAADAQDIAVLDLEAVHGVKPSMAEVLSDILLSRLTDSRRFKSIVAGEDLRDMISLEEQKQAIGCDDESCMTALGGALGVPLMAVPSIGRIGDQFILNFKVINVDDAKVLVRKTVSVRREVDLPRGVLTLTEDALKALFGEDATMTAQQLERRFTRRIMRRSALVLGVGAIGSLSWSLVDLGGAQAAHDDPISGLTTTTYDNLKAAQGVAVVTRWSAIGGAALATALWALAPAIDAP